MDPVSSLLIGHAAGKLLDAVGVGFRTNVIERWSRHRAEQFFRTFCEEVARRDQPESEQDLHQSLNQILEDEECSEVLFDAYRRVAMSRSKSVGPRIVALLTAEIVGERRTATDDEDVLFAAAEQLTDDDLDQFVAFIAKERSRGGRLATRETGTSLEIPWGEHQFDSAWKSSRPESVSSPNLGEELGVGANASELGHSRAGDPRAHLRLSGRLRTAHRRGRDHPRSNLVGTRAAGPPAPC